MSIQYDLTLLSHVCTYFNPSTDIPIGTASLPQPTPTDNAAEVTRLRLLVQGQQQTIIALTAQNTVLTEQMAQLRAALDAYLHDDQ